MCFPSPEIWTISISVVFGNSFVPPICLFVNFWALYSTIHVLLLFSLFSTPLLLFSLLPPVFLAVRVLTLWRPSRRTRHQPSPAGSPQWPSSLTPKAPRIRAPTPMDPALTDAHRTKDTCLPSPSTWHPILVPSLCVPSASPSSTDYTFSRLVRLQSKFGMHYSSLVGLE